MASELSCSLRLTSGALAATTYPAPPMLPPGAQIAVLAGDPGAAPYTVRLKFPANYAVGAHLSDDENARWSGAVVGMGNKLDKTAGRRPHRRFCVAAGANHYVHETGNHDPLYGMGPGNKHVNPRTIRGTRRRMVSPGQPQVR
jgi:hypothetical protein